MARRKNDYLFIPQRRRSHTGIFLLVLLLLAVTVAGALIINHASNKRIVLSSEKVHVMGLAKEYEGFSLYSRRRIGFEFEVGKEDAKNLFKMTPYFYKTSEADAKKLDSAEKIVTEADFYITVYRKDQ